MRGAEAVVRSLRAAGVETVFSLSGNQIMPIYDACIDADIRIVHTRHEAAAVYMAEAWAQVTGDLGVALVTAAPGFANAISPLYTARMSESAVLFLSGDAPVGGDGLGPFQEMDQTAVTAPLVKRALRPRSADALGPALAEAVRIALSGRPGPVHVALPFDVLNAGDGVAAGPSQMARIAHPLDPDTAVAAVNRLARARQPLIVAGPALAGHRGGEALAALRGLGAPVVPIESPRGLRDPALGAFPEVLREADLILSVGKALDFAVGFARPPAVSADCEVIAIDPEWEALDRAARLCGERLIVSACADADLAARTLAEGPKAAPEPGWTDRVSAALSHRTEDSDAGERIHARDVGAAVQRVLDAADDPILICDGGEFGQWAQAVCQAPVRLINGLSGAIGGGLCYALAAKLGRPEATVIALMGDGTAGFHFAEFETAAREGAGFVAVIGNDARWNAEYQLQLREYGPERTIGCTLSEDARYDRAAAAFGCHGAQVTEAAALDGALRDALASGRPACLDVAIAGLAAPKYSPFGP